MLLFVFCNDTAATEIYTYLPTLSRRGALPILIGRVPLMTFFVVQAIAGIIYAGIARHLTRKYMEYPLMRDSGFTLTALALMLGLFALIGWILPYLRTMV